MSNPITTDSPPSADHKAVIFFWASWHESSAPGGATEQLYQTLAESAAPSSSPVSFYQVEAESVPNLCEKYGVTVVPTFILLNADGSIFARVEGADDIPALTQSVSALQSKPSTIDNSIKTSSESTSSESKDTLDDQLKSLINSSKVMLFMKGVPGKPRCGFSRQAVELLSSSNIPFGSFDILQNEEVRQGLKVYSDWPTYPQLYVDGELIGGLDIMKEMSEEDGGLADQLGVSTTESNDAASSIVQEESLSLDERLKKLVNRDRIMLFMKGVPSQPKCGFSNTICQILDSISGVSYDAFDILQDEEVRQGLKKYSDWPTYPQLYVDGELVGGLDIVKEMQESGELDDLLKG